MTVAHHLGGWLWLVLVVRLFVSCCCFVVLVLVCWSTSQRNKVLLLVLAAHCFGRCQHGRLSESSHPLISESWSWPIDSAHNYVSQSWSWSWPADSDHGGEDSRQASLAARSRASLSLAAHQAALVTHRPAAQGSEDPEPGCWAHAGAGPPCALCSCFALMSNLFDVAPM